MCMPLGKMKGLTFMQYQQYKTSVGVFKMVEAYNANISTLRGNGDLSQSYYVFTGNEEETNYTNGQFILVQNDPKNASKYTSVQKN